MSRETLATYVDAMTTNELEATFTPKIVQRGRDYFLHHNVAALSLGPGRVTAKVLGTDTYTVEIIRAGGYVTPVCDCPYDAPCKHMVAVLLELRERTAPDRLALFDRPPEEDPFVRHLAGLEADELRRLLLLHAPDHYREALRQTVAESEVADLSERFAEDVRAYQDPEATLQAVAGNLLELRRYVRSAGGRVNAVLGDILEELEREYLGWH